MLHNLEWSNMRRIFKPLFWGLVFLLILVALDQVLVRVQPVHPAHAAVREFYRDFRSRLFSIIEVVPPDAPQSIEAVIDQGRKAGANASSDQKLSSKAATIPTKPTRYVYADQDGALQFADSLEQVPAAYRASAEPLED